jgi:hypothetical protein
MDADQAKELLLIHSLSHPDRGHPKLATGFLGSLKTYRGLREDAYHEVMQALITLAPQFRYGAVDRDVIKALWSICDFGRQWGLHPTSALQRNHLISTAEAARLEKWIDAISQATLMLLDGADIATALGPYRKAK